MKQFGSRWKWKDGELTLRWKKRKIKGVHYCAVHGGQEINKQGQCVMCAPKKKGKIKDEVCYDLPDYGDDTRPE
jgi:hypothetical protein